VAVLTGAGYVIGARTTTMSYAELVHTATASVKQHFVWLIPALLVLFVGYVLISKKIMQSREPAPVATR
jgi:hypothetical protein